MVKPQLVAMDAIPTPPSVFTKQSAVDVVIIQLHAQPVNSTPLDVIPTTPPCTNPPLPQSTPVKIETSTTCPFTTNQKYRVESCTAMGEEMAKYLVGPMPPQQFLDEFFPVSKLPGLDSVPLVTPGCYCDTVETEREEASYKHFVHPLNEFHYPPHTCLFKVKTTQEFTPNLRIVNSSASVDCNPCSDFSFKIKPDVAVYCSNSDPDVKTDSTLAEMFIEFKWTPGDDPFCDPYDRDCPHCKVTHCTKSFLPETKSSKDTLGQITSYAAAHLGAQFRMHIFSVFIMKDTARIL
jgi:hypothetical protein